MGAPLSPGATLPNGAVVVSSRSLGIGRHVVLAVRVGYDDEPWVTWLARADGVCSNGHYHDDLAEAVAEFAGRR